MRRNGRENDLPFHQRELVPDADSSSTTERHVGEARQRRFAVRQETIRIETQRIFEQPRIAMQQPGRDQHDLVFTHLNPPIEVSRRAERASTNAGG